MKLRGQILRMLRPENGGPRKRTVLEGLAGSASALKRVLVPMLKKGELVQLGATKGQRIGRGPAVDK